MPSTTSDLLRRLASLGATRRLQELQDEANELTREFPELRGDNASPGRRVSTSAQPAAVATTKRKRRKMTAAQRKAVGERMKKYWAERRKAK